MERLPLVTRSSGILMWGTYYAGVRRFHFALLGSSREHSPKGAQAVEEYGNPGVVRGKLAAHRADGL